MWKIEIEEPVPDDETDDTDDSPLTLSELSDESALPLSKLQEIEDALLAKQQVILTAHQEQVRLLLPNFLLATSLETMVVICKEATQLSSCTPTGDTRIFF